MNSSCNVAYSLATSFTSASPGSTMSCSSSRMRLDILLAAWPQWLTAWTTVSSGSYSGNWVR